MKRLNEIRTKAASTLDTHIANVRKSVKTSEPVHNMYQHGGGIIKNQKVVATQETHQDLFNHLKGHGYKKTSGYDPTPHTWTSRHSPDTMTHTTDPMHHPSGISVHLSQTHGSPTKMVFTHHKMNEETINEGLFGKSFKDHASFMAHAKKIGAHTKEVNAEKFAPSHVASRQGVVNHYTTAHHPKTGEQVGAYNHDSNEGSLPNRLKEDLDHRQHADPEDAPHTYLDKPHLVRLNTILTQLTGKLFLSLQVYVDAVRAALDFHGFKLPHLDCEQVTDGPKLGIAYGDLKHGPGFEDNRNTPTVAPEFEYVFELKYDQPTKNYDGKDPEEYLYMVASQVKLEGEGNFWECYAQVVNAEELEELTANDEDPRQFPDLSGDASGETEYLKLQRHTNTSGTSPEIED